MYQTIYRSFDPLRR